MIIYKAENLLNGKVYIGMTKNKLKYRIHNHLKSAEDGSVYWFHQAIRKHGSDSFEWSILCKCDDYNKLKIIEKFYIKAYKLFTGIYNMSHGGDGHIFTDEQRAAISKRQTGKNNSFYGKTHSDKLKKKMSQIYSGEGNPMHGTSRGGKENPNYDHSFDKMIPEIIEKYNQGWSFNKMSGYFGKDRRTIKRRVLSFYGNS